MIDGGTPFRNKNYTKNPEAVLDENDYLNINIPGSKTAFGELAVAEFRPQCGWSFNYNINDSVIKKTVTNSGAVTQEGSFTKNGEAQVFTLPLGKADSKVIDLNAIDAEIMPEQKYAITAESSGISDIIVGVDFRSRT